MDDPLTERAIEDGWPVVDIARQKERRLRDPEPMAPATDPEYAELRAAAAAEVERMGYRNLQHFNESQKHRREEE